MPDFSFSKKSEGSRVSELLREAYDVRVRDLQKSMELANAALEISKKIEDTSLVARSLSRISLFEMILGDYDKAMKHGKEALGLFQVLEDEQGIADVKYNIAGVYYKTDNFHRGLVYLVDCLKIYRKFEDHHNQARVQKSLGTIYEYFGDEKSAILAYEESIAAARKVGAPDIESNAYNPLSGIYLRRGNIKKASELIERSISMKQQTGDVRGLAFALYGKAKILFRQKKYEEAVRAFREAIAIHEKMGERLGVAMSYYKLGALYLEKKDLKNAIRFLKKARKTAKKYNIALIKFRSNYLMYEIYKGEGDPVTALKYLEVYLKDKEAVINTQTQKVIESYDVLATMERLQKEAQMQREKAEIMAKKDRAEQASRMKQEFLSTMSHEIRTPLNAVITITSLLEERSDPENRKLLESLKFSADNLLRIINDILDFNKLDAGKVHLELQPVAFNTWIENVKDIYAGMAREKGVALQLHVDIRVSRYYLMDETKLSQIMGNLISNSIKFSEKGEIDVKVELLDSTDRVDHMRFSVEDMGIGIPESFLGEIFDSFSQARPYTTRRQGGSGLGLAIVKKLVELLGGEIHVESREGVGSNFYFEISLEKGDPATPVLKERSDQLAGKSVLIAEDNMINAMVCIKLLSNWGLKATHARNGLEVLDLSDKQRYDYILMDIHMPELDGFDAAKQIRQTENPNAATPIFALTADINARQQETFAPYFNGFLLKPIEQDKLYKALTFG